MDDYESKKFIAKSENITAGEILDIWAEEELKTGTPVSYPHLNDILPLSKESPQYRNQHNKDKLICKSGRKHGR